MGRWYRLDARRTGVSADPSEGGHQGDEHPAGQAEADQVDAAGPGGADAERRQQEAGEGGQGKDDLKRVGHGAAPFRVRVSGQAPLHPRGMRANLRKTTELASA